MRREPSALTRRTLLPLPTRVTLHELNKYDEAVAEKREAVRLEPNNAEYRDQVGITLSTMKRYAEAIAEKRVAVALEPSNAEYHFSLANTLTWLDLWAEAEAEYREAIRLDPSNAEYKEYLQKAIDAQKKKYRRINKTVESPSGADVLSCACI